MANKRAGMKDKTLGTIKEEFGKLTGNTELQFEGRAQQVAGEIKDGVSKAKDFTVEFAEDAREMLDSVKHKAAELKDEVTDTFQDIMQQRQQK